MTSASASANEFFIFTQSTREAFSRYLCDNPNNRRISQSDKDILIEWLTNPYKRPLTQEEFSRRNDVRKTFIWDKASETLLALAKEGEGQNRVVITTDMIVDIVESVHKASGGSGHGGWDATWKDISTSYYGILRSDVIFLVKQCQRYAQNLSKRPKGSGARLLQTSQDNHESIDFLNVCGMHYENPTTGIPKSENYDKNNVDRFGQEA